MSSIAGFFQPNARYSKENEFCKKTIQDMSKALRHRGPDQQSFHYFAHGAFSHNFLLAGYIPTSYPREVEPVTLSHRDTQYTLFMDGFISNIPELAEDLEAEGFCTDGLSIEKILLMSYVLHGTDFIKRTRGAYAIAVYDAGYSMLHLFRDPLGLKPLFFCRKGYTLIFASEIKALFKYPGICPVLDREGLTHLLSLGPARRPGNAIFTDIYEVKPGHVLSFGREYFREEPFHRFHMQEHTDCYEDTAAHIRFLLNRSIGSLNTSLMPMACLLSGGLDSSVVTAKLAGESPEPLSTYSLEFKDAASHFKANAFQPSLDAPFVHEMVSTFGTNHQTCICDNDAQFTYLKNSVLAHDLPTMADVDSSYLFFCEKVSQTHKIIFTGECADEIFCGYPWYHSHTPDSKTFPWTTDLSPRKCLLKDDLINSLSFAECVSEAYLDCCKEIGLDGNHTPDEHLHQKYFYLTIRYFMQTLVNRGDRAAAANSMDARMPFADLELAEYLFNVPLSMQTNGEQKKYLLREYASNLLPESIRLRKKSPYPKTYDPAYESMINQELLYRLSKPGCPLAEIVDRTKADIFCRQSKDLGRPWYGQLMAGPQLTAHYLQILYWLEEYNINIVL